MSRPLKDGADYFPKDCGFYRDDKIRILRCEFGAKGMYLLDYILCELYEKDGYYMKWDDRKCYLVSDGAGCGCSPGFIKEFVDGCIRESVFDKEVFDMFGILTSRGIQRRFIRRLNSRKKFTFIKEYFLLDRTDEEDVPAGILIKLSFKSISDIENPVINKENSVNSTVNPQSKGKESKVKERKEDITPAAPIRHKYGQYQNVLLSDDDMRKLQSEFPDWKDRIERLSEYMASAGKQYKSHLATIRSWSRRDSEAAITSKPQQKNSFNRYSKPGGEEEDEALLRLIAEKQMRERSCAREQQT